MKENGFAIVMMLMVLLSVGAALGLQQSKLNSASSLNQGLSRLQSLSAAKQSLLHYTSTYSDLYGASGSGPGHLPCPDTDAYLVSPDDSGRVSPFFGDSPDPPCGNGSHALGYLPRHVSLVDLRYAFHVDARQSIWYRLASSHVNNPLGRVVNSQSDQAVSARRKIVDLVSPRDDVLPLRSELFDLLDSRDDGVLFNKRGALATLPISDFEILRVTTRRVLRWFIDTYHHSRVISCESHGRCNAVPESLIGCQDTDLAEVAMLRWVLIDSDASSCHVPMLEDIAVSRHWFIRNQWFDSINVTIHDACVETHYSNCRLIRKDDHNLILVSSS